MYRVELVKSGQPTDTKISINPDLDLFVQDEAKAIVQGTEIDYKRDGLNEVVKFNNPNVTSECGCGESFVVENS
jgi:iron-sulfur cluster assembly accessory protein